MAEVFRNERREIVDALGLTLELFETDGALVGRPCVVVSRLRLRLRRGLPASPLWLSALWDSRSSPLGPGPDATFGNGCCCVARSVCGPGLPVSPSAWEGRRGGFPG